MPQPFKGRWTPVPDDAGLALLASGRHHAFIVLYAMLADATANQCWRTSRSIANLMRETNLSKNTILKAQKELIAAGYIARAAGGERQKITFEITPIENFGQKQLPEKKDSKPTGNWEL